MQIKILLGLLAGPLLFFQFANASHQNFDSTTARRAEKLFHEYLYGDALYLYEELFLSTQNGEGNEQWALRLAFCQLAEKQPQKTIQLLSSLNMHSKVRNDILFLMSLANKQLGDYSKALSLLEQCSETLPYHSRSVIILEKSSYFIRMGDLENAKRVLNSVKLDISTPFHYASIQLQLAKIALIQRHHEEALELLRTSVPSSMEPIRLYLQGWAHMGLQQEPQAFDCFEQLARNLLPLSSSAWSLAVLNGLVASTLKQAMKCRDPQKLKRLFAQTEPFLEKWTPHPSHEHGYPLLSDFYLIKAKSLADTTAYSKAREIAVATSLSASDLNPNLLKLAAAAPTYEERVNLYENLIDQSSSLPSFCAKVWFYKGINDLEEGFNLHTSTLFDQAAKAFGQSIICSPLSTESALSHQYSAIAYLQLSDEAHARLALEHLERLNNNEILRSFLPHPEKIHLLYAWAALRVHDAPVSRKAQQALARLADQDALAILLQGQLLIQLEVWEKADLLFGKLIQDPSQSFCGEAWFWKGYCAGKQQQENLQKEYFQLAYTRDPSSPYAPIAYFNAYTYRDYMQGRRKAMKHLQAMPRYFPHHPLLINTYYLIGLYNTKDLLSEDGQVVRRKDWTAAIDAFQQAESTFDTLVKEGMISASELSYYTTLRHHAQLERAKANLAIAQHASGGKKIVYLEYAEEVFKDLIDKFKNPQTTTVQQIDLYPKTWAEAEFYLAKLYEEKQEWNLAEAVLLSSLAHYDQAAIQEGYGLMRAYTEIGKVSQRAGNPQAALLSFEKAERAGKKHLVASPREKLDLWILQSICFKEMNELDHSMRILSRVINDDVVSPLRIKAMLMRADLYEMQGRPELAIKQLEAAALKGGKWAQQAKDKLEKIYGYSLSLPRDSR